jgi:hypothetical protein
MAVKLADNFDCEVRETQIWRGILQTATISATGRALLGISLEWPGDLSFQRGDLLSVSQVGVGTPPNVRFLRTAEGAVPVGTSQDLLHVGTYLLSEWATRCLPQLPDPAEVWLGA